MFGALKVIAMHNLTMVSYGGNIARYIDLVHCLYSTD